MTCHVGKLFNSLKSNVEHQLGMQFDRRLGGIIDAVDPNREIGFGFVSCSCRACVRACEAVWVRVGACSSTLEARTARNPTPARGGLFHFLLLYAWVLRFFFSVFNAIRIGF